MATLGTRAALPPLLLLAQVTPFMLCIVCLCVMCSFLAGCVVLPQLHVLHSVACLLPWPILIGHLSTALSVLQASHVACTSLVIEIYGLFTCSGPLLLLLLILAEKFTWLIPKQSHSICLCPRAHILS